MSDQTAIISLTAVTALWSYLWRSHYAQGELHLLLQPQSQQLKLYVKHNVATYMNRVARPGLWYRTNGNIKNKNKAKQSPVQAWAASEVPGQWGSQISRQLTHEGGKVVSPTHRQPLRPGNIPCTHFCYRLEGSCRWKFQWHHRESNPWPSGL